jgi:hypothetical protein
MANSGQQPDAAGYGAASGRRLDIFGHRPNASTRRERLPDTDTFTGFRNLFSTPRPAAGHCGYCPFPWRNRVTGSHSVN